MSTISAGTTSTTALVSTGDTTGNLILATGATPTTALTLNSTTQAATFAGAVNFASWTTATRPASPVVGQMGYNTTTGNFDMYIAGAWTTNISSSTGVVLSSQMPVGSVIQVVAATTGSAVSTTSPTFITTGLTGTITPKFSTSKIFVVLSGEVRADANHWMQTALYKNGSILTNITAGLHYRFDTDSTTQLNYSYLDSPATTSATTYALYFNAQAGGTVSFNIDLGTACITLMEIAA
jgi:hypothetical protein